ncbi:MAG: DegT/DnrJ/EryC1/StrS family aminotransferase [Actinomycetota bacterium]|nr:DegT/DnrJ/EryC1/StrS family aminotransferase [Actinomycetota bacterium]
MAEPPIDVPLLDLHSQLSRIRVQVERAIAAVLDHGRFILGPEVARLEQELARMTGAGHVVGCSSGTDALLVALLAYGVGPGDAVLVPSFTFVATAEAVVRCGATPVFVDVRADTLTVDPESVAAGQARAREAGLRPVGLIPVDLFGQPADYDTLAKVATAGELWVLADAAQSLGGSLAGRPVGSLAEVTATSFFPAKPLGCYGDGGALFTDSAELAARFRSLRVHGRGSDTYDNVLVGLNARLDTLQAAILLAKLEVFSDELARRRAIADRYTAALAEVVAVPGVLAGAMSAWACYTVRVADRDRVRERLRQAGIASAVYYRTPLHRQPAFSAFPTAPGRLAVSDKAASEVLSLPSHPYLEEATQDRVIEALQSAAALLG